MHQCEKKEQPFIPQLFASDTASQHHGLQAVEDSICNEIDQVLRDYSRNGFPHVDELQKQFSNYIVPEDGTDVEVYLNELIKNVVPYAVNTYSPRFIGHMTSALPEFMVSLAKVMVKLNQNVVKVETSRIFTPLERQALCQVHHLIYRKEETYYETLLAGNNCLGSFCSGGTIANLTALWYARNRLFVSLGDSALKKYGILNACEKLGYKGMAVLVSERAHYSLRKSADVLGLGEDFLISVPVDRDNKVRTDLLETACARLREQHIAIIAIVGIAGTTETGNIDDLNGLADIAAKYQCHFHVDAAWGGATLFSQQYRHLLDGIERADSVTMDAHKQMYTPMGVGMVLFRSPMDSSLIQYNAEYIIRRGSADLGSHTLEGSRPAMSLYLSAALRIIGRSGYEYLINQSIEKAKKFAHIIQNAADFELITEPELCILTYRYVPLSVKQRLLQCDVAQQEKINNQLNTLTAAIQNKLFEVGPYFVSRTVVKAHQYDQQKICVFRVVLANPLTTEQNLREILNEQRFIARSFCSLVEDICSSSMQPILMDKAG